MRSSLVLVPEELSSGCIKRVVPREAIPCRSTRVRLSNDPKSPVNSGLTAREFQVWLKMHQRSLLTPTSAAWRPKTSPPMKR